MKFNDIKNDKQLWEFMTNPSEELAKSVFRLRGDMLILGGSGKMGRELTGLVCHADDLNGINRKITVASTFSNHEDLENFKKMGVSCIKGDLTDENVVKSLPNAPLVIYMLGFKFGSKSNWRRSFHVNAIVPYLVGRKFSESKILVFSSGNPYTHTPVLKGGSKESDLLDPSGIYGWSIVARESAFMTTAMQHPDQKICLFRLMYAQHLNYGVLVDLALMLSKNEAISLKMPAVNLVSQRDANEIAIRSLEFCDNPLWKLNVAGPIVNVREIVIKLSELMGKTAVFLNDESDKALLADDSLCINTFGKHRDCVDDMIEGAAWWVMNKGQIWNKPTNFGRVDHNY